MFDAGTSYPYPVTGITYPSTGRPLPTTIKTSDKSQLNTTTPSATVFPMNSTEIPVIINGSDSMDGSIGLLYVFSEASKRLPIHELPMHVDYMGQSINNWAGNTVKGIGNQATSFGDTFVEYLQSAAGEVIKKSGEILTTSLNSLERTVKEYMADWLGCRKRGRNADSCFS